MKIYRNLILFTVLLIVFVLNTLTYADSQRIQNLNNKNWYQRIDTPMTWNKAKLFCEKLDAHLATATSESENTFIWDNFACNSPRYIWLGGTDEAEEGVWRWITGEMWDFTKWDGGEPNNACGDEDYLHISSENTREAPYTWNDQTDDGTCADYPGPYFPLCEWENNEQCNITDSDGDGVIDQWDSCPKTPENSCVNNKGCSCELSIIEEKGSVVKDKWKTYYANVDNTYSNFIVKIQNLTDDVDLYVKKDNKPDINTYDCRPYKGGKRDEVCELSNSGDNLWYFSIYGYKTGEFTISVKAKR